MPINIFSAKPPSEEEITADPSVVSKYLIELKEVINTLDKHYLDINGSNSINKGLTFKSSPLINPIKHGTIEYLNGHWYLSNGTRKVIVLSDGIKIESTDIINTTNEIVIYSHTFKAYELHESETIFSTITGAYSNASASDDFDIKINLAGSLLHTVNRVGGNVSEVGLEITHIFTLRNDGSTGSYVHSGKIVDDNNVYTFAHHSEIIIDTTKEVLFEITMQWNNAKVDNDMTITQGFLQFLH